MASDPPIGACGCTSPINIAVTVAAGRHVRYPTETPINNLWLSLLDRIDARVEGFRDSTGRINDMKTSKRCQKGRVDGPEGGRASTRGKSK